MSMILFLYLYFNNLISIIKVAQLYKYNKKLRKKNYIVHSMSSSLQKKERSITQCFNPKYRKIIKKDQIYTPLTLQNDKKQQQALQKDLSNNQNNIFKKVVSSKEGQFTNGQSLKKLKSSEYKDDKNIVQQMANQIKNVFFKLNLMIQKSGKYYEQRMKTHESQLIKIVFSQIKRIQQQCEKTIYKYNSLIKRTMNNEQLAEARQQIQFFKQAALDLNSQNQNLQKEIKHLKKMVYEMEIKIKSQYDVIKDLSYKLVKYKTFNKQKLNKINEIQHHSVGSPNLQKSLSLTTPSKGYISGRQTQKLKSHFNVSLTPIHQLINNNQKISPISYCQKSRKEDKFSNIQKQLQIKFNLKKQKQMLKPTDFLKKKEKHDNLLQTNQKQTPKRLFKRIPKRLISQSNEINKVKLQNQYNQQSYNQYVQTIKKKCSFTFQ